MRGHENKLFEYFLLQAVIGGGSVTVPCIPSGRKRKAIQRLLLRIIL